MIEVYEAVPGKPNSAADNPLIDALEVPPKGMLPNVGDLLSLIDNRNEPSLRSYKVVAREFRWHRANEEAQEKRVATWSKIWLFARPADADEGADTIAYGDDE